MKILGLANGLKLTLMGSSLMGGAVLLLIDTSIKSFMLLIFASIVCLVLAKASAAMRHLIWIATLSGVVMMPFFAGLLPEFQVLPNWLSLDNEITAPVLADQTRLDQVPSIIDPPKPTDSSFTAQQPSTIHDQPASNNQLVVANSAPPQLAPSNSNPVSWKIPSSLMALVWFVGCLTCLIPIGIAFIRLSRIERAASEQVDASLLKHVDRIATQLKIAAPKVIIGPANSMPMVWTFWRSRLLMPADVSDWNHSRLESVLFHELVHLRRRDPLVFLVGLVARAMNWFNPLAWYAVHRLKIECECACDDHVLRMGVEADQYATHLLEVVAGRKASLGTGTVAMAVVTPSKVEDRIRSILDQRLNRCGVTFLRVAIILLAVSVSAATLAAVSVNRSRTLTVTDNRSFLPLDETKIKWPHCIVDIENLEPRSLQDAVSTFNQQSKESPIGHSQLPVSVQEVIDAIEQMKQRSDLPDSIQETLSTIVETKELPSNTYFRRFTRLDDERRFHGVWWVRLVVKTEAGPAYSVPVRTKTIFTRPYTQMERQQNAQPGVTLLNRFSSYYAELPKLARDKDLPPEAIAKLKQEFEKALKAKNFSDLESQFQWSGATESNRAFVKSELEMLMASKVHYIDITSNPLSGDLVHWSGYQHYQPNLTVAGFMNIEFTPESGPPGVSKRIAFELGQVEGALKLINYVVEGELELPQGKMPTRSHTGSTEPLADGTFLLTTVTTNPDTLVSAHLANEEVWQRDYNNVRAQPKEGKNNPQTAVEPDKSSSTGPVELEKSRRLESLFSKLNVTPKQTASAHARDLPDLFQPDPNNQGKFIPREDRFLINFDFGVENSREMEKIWIAYLPHQSRFYIQHRFHQNNPRQDRVFGPYQGNPYALLPELEANLRNGLSTRDSNAMIRIRRMMKQENPDLTQRVAKLFDHGLDLEFEITEKNYLVKSIAHTMDTYQKAFSDPSLATLVTSIKDRIQAFEDQIDELTIEFPDEDYLAAQKSRKYKIPEEIADELWGEPVDGLRFAVVPESKTFHFLKPVKVTLVVENTGQDNIKFCVHDLIQDVRPEITFDGKQVWTQSTWFSGWPPTNRYILRPGDQVALAESTLCTFMSSRPETATSGFGVTDIPVTALQLKSSLENNSAMQVNYTMRIGQGEAWSRGDDGVMRIYSPAKGEWKGALPAGGFEIKLRK